MGNGFLAVVEDTTMALRTRTVVEQRYELVMEWLRDEVGKEELCRRYRTCRKTACKWVNRFQEHGRAGLEDLSRAPHRHGRSVAEEVVRAIKALKKRYRHWGARKLAVKLREESPEMAVPSLSTVHRILERQGLTRPRRRKRRVPPWEGKFTTADRPNRVWRADYKGLFLTGDGQRCEPLTVTDGRSVYLLVLKQVRGTGHEEAWRAFRAAFIRYGLPDVILTDNGNPFVTSSVTGLTRLGVLWAKLGIRHERIDPGRPQQNGSHERFHGTLARETAQPPAATRAGQARRFSRFQRYYNEERPHEALGQMTPASCYWPSKRRWPARLPQPSYPARMQLRRVRHNGMIKWQGGHVYIGEVLRGERLGIEPAADGRPPRVHFFELELGLIDGPEGAKILQRTAPPPRGRRRASRAPKQGKL
jgi:transposase InsO family protein